MGFSPRAWGWSGQSGFSGVGDRVLPTCVGMVRRGAPCSRLTASSPHVRGDGPQWATGEHSGTQFSPRAWGWSVVSTLRRRRRGVLPTCVGMVRLCKATPGPRWCSPHVRGDGPMFSNSNDKMPAFSPRAWGWSEDAAAAKKLEEVLPTCVGMVRTGVPALSSTARSPHVRGDGPITQAVTAAITAFSPRAWGWSAPVIAIRPLDRVLPTCVGMVR